MPVGPEDAVSLDMHVHRIDAHAGITLEGLLVAPVRHAGVQAADFIVVCDVENLPNAVQAISLACVIDPGEVLVAAAFIGAFGVVADVGTCSELQTLILISTGVVACLLEAWFAGAEGVCAVGDTVGLVSITTHSHVAPAVIKFCVCLAVDFIRAIVLTVVKEVTAQSGADASAIGAQELILLTCGNSWRDLAVHFIRVVAAVIDAITPLYHFQTYAVVLAAESSGGRTLELPALFRILIRVVPTIILPVTLPGEWFTQSVVTLELIQRAVTSCSTATVLLITTVHAVRVGITPPADGDTVSVLTLELVVVTLQITAMLIRSISTVMVSIALPPPGNTAAIRASKLTF